MGCPRDVAKLAGARGHFTFEGTPEQVADLMEDWIEDDAADGFNLMPPVLPEMLDVFISEVVPLRRRRGRVRTAYDGKTWHDPSAFEVSVALAPGSYIASPVFASKT
jgi:hypothetical protein